jgi:quinol monooxygenase YgiN
MLSKEDRHGHVWLFLGRRWRATLATGRHRTRMENMWIRMGSFFVKPDRVDRLRAVYNGQAVPRVRAQPGNLACLLLEPVGDDRTYRVVTVWSSRAAGEAYDASGTAAEIVGLVRDCFAGPPKLESYECASLAGLPVGGPDGRGRPM